jgi:outer membrane protein TolC
MVALVVIALTAGAAAGAAPARVQESRQRSDLIAAQEAELRVARMRLDLANAEMQDAQRRFNLGTISRNELAAAEAGLRAMESVVQRISINLDEIRASGLAPRDDISAPLVAERDFVAQRVQLELRAAQDRLLSVEQSVNDVARRQRVGVVSPMELAEAEADLQRARSELRKLTEVLDLRQQVLSQRLSAEESERRLDLIRAVQDRDNLRNMLELAEQRLETVRTRVAIGRSEAGELDLKRAELEVLQRRIELSQAERQVQIREELARRAVRSDTIRNR